MPADLPLTEQAIADLRHLAATRPAAVWAALIKTPEGRAAAVELAKTMPRFAGPRENEHNGTFRRGSWVVTSPSIHDHYIGFAYRWAGTIEMAQKEEYADERLRAAGWVLVDEPAGVESEPDA